MLTLREFIEKINFREHFRIYQMNMDGLIYESYYTVHSPYFFDKEHEEKREYFNDKYYSDNKFCDDVRTNENKGIDEEQIIYINFEFEDYYFIKNDLDLHNYIKDKIVNDKKYYFTYLGIGSIIDTTKRRLSRKYSI